MKILFVCTGNIFRSFSAEYCARKLAQDKGIEVEARSAGTEAMPQRPDRETVRRLNELGIYDINHKQTKLSKEVLESYDVVIAMGHDHKEFIKHKFGIDVPLFNEIARGERTGVLDIHENVKDWLENREATEEHIRMTVNHIYESMPSFLENIEKFKR